MTDTQTIESIPPEAVDTSSIMKCYGVLGLGMGMALVNYMIVSALGIGLMLWGIVWAYRIRKKESPTGVFQNHGSWMVRTFWVGSAYMLAAIILWTSVISANADFAMFQNIDPEKAADAIFVENLSKDFVDKNSTLLLVTSLACYGPVLLINLVRMYKGYRLADAGKPVENLKTWWI